MRNPGVAPGLRVRCVLLGLGAAAAVLALTAPTASADVKDLLHGTTGAATSIGDHVTGSVTKTAGVVRTTTKTVKAIRTVKPVRTVKTVKAVSAPARRLVTRATKPSSSIVHQLRPRTEIVPTRAVVRTTTRTVRAALPRSVRPDVRPTLIKVRPSGLASDASALVTHTVTHEIAGVLAALLPKDPGKAVVAPALDVVVPVVGALTGSVPVITVGPALEPRVESRGPVRAHTSPGVPDTWVPTAVTTHPMITSVLPEAIETRPALGVSGTATPASVAYAGGAGRSLGGEPDRHRSPPGPLGSDAGSSVTAPTGPSTSHAIASSRGHLAHRNPQRPTTVDPAVGWPPVADPGFAPD